MIPLRFSRSAKACVSRAVPIFFHQIGGIFPDFHDCQTKTVYNKNKAAFSDNISRSPFGECGPAVLLSDFGQGPSEPDRNGVQRYPLSMRGFFSLEGVRPMKEYR